MTALALLGCQPLVLLDSAPRVDWAFAHLREDTTTVEVVGHCDGVPWCVDLVSVDWFLNTETGPIWTAEWSSTYDEAQRAADGTVRWTITRASASPRDGYAVTASGLGQSSEPLVVVLGAAGVSP